MIYDFGFWIEEKTMRAKTKTANRRKACRHEANREKRQELARLRHEANLNKVGEREHQSKAANRGRLKGKGLFYCDSPLEAGELIGRGKRNRRNAGVEELKSALKSARRAG